MFPLPAIGIGLLRTLLAIAVVMAHSSSLLGFRLPDGTIAVQTFYIISGFYMSLILNQKYANKRLFYTNRFLRLYPIYFIVLLLTLLLCCAARWSGHSWLRLNYFALYKNVLKPSTLGFMIFSNLALIGQDLAVFMNLDPMTGSLSLVRHAIVQGVPLHGFLLVPQAWTISLEVTFYAMAPWLVKAKARFLWIVLILDLALRVYLYRMGLNFDPWTYRFFPTELALFVMGILAYKYYAERRTALDQLSCKVVTWLVLTATLLFQYFPVPYLIKQWIFYAAVTLSLPWLFSYSKSSPLDRKIGNLSYAIYISHFWVCMALGILGSRMIKQAIDLQYYGILAVTGSILFGLLLEVYVQDPIDRYRERRVTLARQGTNRAITDGGGL